ncbi:MAG: dihydroneopterin aldolase [Bacteroidales bacterium]|nr:dihydroneopterin aldolase [Bacteroidales bacterium]
MGRIILEGMKFRGHIGTTAEERAAGNDFEITVGYDCNTLRPGLSDNLNDAVDYSKVFDAVSEEMAVECSLIENLGHRLMRRLVTGFPNISNIRLRIRKKYPAVAGHLECSVLELTSASV